MHSHENYDSFLKVAISCAQAAGQLIEQAFGQDKDVEFKGALDLVTVTDKQCEETILQAITRAFPSHKFIGEEGSSAQGFTNDLTDEPTWCALLKRMTCAARPRAFENSSQNCGLAGWWTH